MSDMTKTMFELVADPSYSSDRARARKLASIHNLDERAAQSRLVRFVHKLSTNSSLVSAKPGRRPAPKLPKLAGSDRDYTLMKESPEYQYWVYCIECVTPNHFYVGISNNIRQRLFAHEKKKGGIFTKAHKVKSWYLVCKTRSKAMALEIELMLYLVLKKNGIIVGGNEFKEVNYLMDDYILKTLGPYFIK